MRWSEAGRYSQAVEAAQGPWVFPGSSSVSAGWLELGLWEPLSCSACTVFRRLPAPFLPGSFLPSSFLSQSSTVSKNRAKIRQWALEKGLWLLRKDFLLREFVPMPPPARGMLFKLLKLSTSLMKKCDTQFGSRDVVTMLCSVRRKNIWGGFKKYYRHAYILIILYVCCSDVGKDDCSVSVRVFVNFYLWSRAQTT